MKISAPMNGMQALMALIGGHAVRHQTWTPINRIQRIWDEYLDEYVVVGRGTTIFVQDCRTGGATWLLERVTETGNNWELWIDDMEEDYQDRLEEYPEETAKDRLRVANGAVYFDRR